MSDEPLLLSGVEPVAQGSNRLCFAHPASRDLMIKVTRPDRTPEIKRRQSSSLRRRLMPAWYVDEQRREIAAYRRLGRRHGQAAWRHIPEFMGTVETDLGLGLVTRFVRNADGSAGTNLTRYLAEGHDTDIAAAVDALAGFVLDLRLVPRDFKPYNVVVSKDGEGRPHAWLVDGFGSAEFIPLSEWSRTHGTRMAQKRVDKFLSGVDARWKYPERFEAYPLTRDE